MRRAEARDLAALEELSIRQLEAALAAAAPEAEAAPGIDDPSIEQMLILSNRIFARERERARDLRRR